jgi:uncharacterized membrane protein YfbV (UPF0208 family)
MSRRSFALPWVLLIGALLLAASRSEESLAGMYWSGARSGTPEQLAEWADLIRRRLSGENVDARLLALAREMGLTLNQ